MKQAVFLIVLLIAVPAHSQSRVYTNADLVREACIDVSRTAAIGEDALPGCGKQLTGSDFRT